jgi:gamma-glutamylcyclotransferase (GGCT)/AIG2-like uncharacterized protein YtfP
MTRLLPYFAYGSNLNPAQMEERCPGHRVLGRARLDRHTIQFRGYGRDWEGAVATIEPHDGETVWGALFELTAEHYATLDEYEGYDGPGVSTNLYDRVAILVVREADGSEVSALTYVMRPDAEGRPSRIYRDAILAGMKHHGLPRDTIAALEAIDTAD